MAIGGRFSIGSQRFGCILSESGFTGLEDGQDRGFVFD